MARDWIVNDSEGDWGLAKNKLPLWNNNFEILLITSQL